MKKYFTYNKDGKSFLFTSCSTAISHALFNGMFKEIKNTDDLYFQVGNTFFMKTEDEAKESGKYEIVM